VQLEYTDAFRCLQQASRKAPQQSALGSASYLNNCFESERNQIICSNSDVRFGFRRFRKTVYKFSTIVQLLLGEIPDRSTFSQKVSVSYCAIDASQVHSQVLELQGMIAALKPYLHIAQVAHNHKMDFP
jgi:hypothetical protein